VSGETVRLSLGVPPSPQYTREVAAAAAEAIRVLNHATFSGQGGALACPSDADAVIRSVATLASRLPQLLDQVREWLRGELRAGRLEAAYGPYAGDPSAALAAAGTPLLDAAAIAARLQAALEEAAGITSTLGASPGPGDDEEPGR
jgi:hypothetical protein